MDTKNSCAGKCIKGIVCDVKSCKYHGTGNHCHAGQIEVGPSNACCTSETVCVTYIPKENK